MGQLDGKVAIVTGAGRGIGREEALALAAAGAKVVVNDMGGDWNGEGSDERPAATVCDEIRALGGEATPNFDNVADPAGAERLVKQTLETYGDVDILVNNAGILRDSMVFSSEPKQWASVIDVHILGHYLPTRAVTAHWREQSKAGTTKHRAIVNTTSESGLFGNAGQSNYDAAKLGIVSFTIAVAKETAKYGVTVNAIAPRARTRLTTTTFDGSNRAGEFKVVDGVFDAMDPSNIAPFVAFLGTDAAAEITGQTFIVYGGIVAHVRLPHVADLIVKDGRWTIDELVAEHGGLFKEIGSNVYEGPRGYVRLPKQ
ncbi:SDR family NAD(P)-dependent oxidoreductase [Rhodococcus jostii]|uniref:NAD(P)-dependent dehydrogenase, short-chain alcohol dehydrogenase family n=1 Tax=Rhodococcus jostii TaxID=132919 RepID=A0A1H4ILH2_RHOJO|nr:SDR family NAD(P)-dependent oxidoreductase [Rhodococcus jostii]SEB34773.1 NAD(P)-dependent dehydrogenase, short-chain alcohol dehydrogenase family [Rhodococcus jostii]